MLGQIERDCNRREALKIGITGIAAMIGISSCSTQQMLNTERDISDLSYTGPISLPSDGVYFGIEGTFERKPEDFTVKKDPAYVKWLYKEQVGGSPKIFCNNTASIQVYNYPVARVVETSAQGMIPLVYCSMKPAIMQYGGSLKKLLKSNKFEQDIRLYARQIKDTEIPILFCTLREINGKWFKWNSDYYGPIKDLYRKVWHIFDAEGANKYASWIISVKPKAGYGRYVYDWHQYYPGDKYVDIVGFSSYLHSKVRGSFISQVYRDYSESIDKYPKPTMMVEMGCLREKYQPKWLEGAFSSMQKMRWMKAAIYWNTTNFYEGWDFTLSKESRAVIRKYFENGLLIPV